LDQAVEKLRQMDRQLGSDVSTMGGLNSTVSSEGVKRDLSQIRIERRTAEAQLANARSSQRMIRAAIDNPDQMLAITGDFLKTQPTLQYLQASLVSAQKTLAAARGRYQQDHPLVKSAQDAVKTVQKQIYNELGTLERGVDSYVATLESNLDRIAQLESAEIDRLTELGADRAKYMQVNSDVAQKTEVLNAIQSELEEVQALRMAAKDVQWITRIDDPQVSTRPDGLGKKAMILGEVLTGLNSCLGSIDKMARKCFLAESGWPKLKKENPAY